MRTTIDLDDDTAAEVQHGLEIISTDGDFARFGEITWIDPVERPGR